MVIEILIQTTRSDAGHPTLSYTYRFLGVWGIFLLFALVLESDVEVERDVRCITLETGLERTLSR